MISPPHCLRCNVPPCGYIPRNRPTPGLQDVTFATRLASNHTNSAPPRHRGVAPRRIGSWSSMEALRKPWEIDLTIYGSEQELLDGLRRRDRMACTCMLKRYMPRLHQLALQVTGDADDAQDVLQEGFIQACRRVDSFEAQSGSSLGTWLYRIVLNSALMHLRKRKPGTVSISQSVEFGEIGGQYEAGVAARDLDLPDPVASPGEQMLSQELREHIDRAILKLPDSLRAAFVLRDVEELSTSEAAAILGIGESALKVRLHRARIALREALAPYLQTTAASDHRSGEPGGSS